MNSFVQRHLSSVTGMLSGFDRVRFRGTILMLAHTGGFAAFLTNIKVKIREFAAFVRESTERVRRATERVAEQAGRPIIYVPKSSTSKEELAREVAQRDGVKEGLICVLRSVEPCWSYDVRKWGSPELKGAIRKCLHYYHYYLHPQFGFMHVRLQSWMPMSFTVCINGREWLARQMDQQGLGYVRADNCFVSLADPAAAQVLMDGLLKTDWPGFLNQVARMANPAHDQVFGGHPQPLEYYWSADQTEWATDVMFKDRAALAAVYPRLVRHGLDASGCGEVLRYLSHKVNPAVVVAAASAPALVGGRPVHPCLKAEVTTDLRRRTDGMRLKHRINDNSIKMYDKHGLALRVETTVNQPRDMKVYRTPQGAPDDAPKKWLPLRKGVADLHRRAQLSQMSNNRYFDSLAAAGEDTVSLGEMAAPACQRTVWKGKPVRPLNPLAPADAELLTAVGRGEFVITGFRNRDLRALLYETRETTPSPTSTPTDPKETRRRSAAITRKLRLLRAHGLIHKVPKTHRYQLSDAGRQLVAALAAARAASTAKLAAAA